MNGWRRAAADGQAVQRRPRPAIPLPVGPVRGAVTFTLIVLNTAVCCVPLFALAIIKALLRLPAAQRSLARGLTVIAEGWVAANSRILARTQCIRWEISGVADLDRYGWYLVIANHRSWVDILALQAALNRHAPFLKFFIKQQLRWVPVLGLAWWALDMPFMKRYSRAELERHPQLKGTDLATTRRACERFRELPTSIINFVEGTRYTPAKAAASASPYRHLLPPRAGGVAFVVGAMGTMLSELIDVTIAYPDGAGGFWDLCSGRITAIVIEIARRPLEPWLAAGDYANDPEFRRRFQAWLAAVWAAKDARLATLLGPGAAGG